MGYTLGPVGVQHENTLSHTQHQKSNIQNMVPSHLDLVGVLGNIPHCQLSTMESTIVHFHHQLHYMGISPTNRNVYTE